jgi:hypothetical protein
VTPAQCGGLGQSRGQREQRDHHEDLPGDIGARYGAAWGLLDPSGDDAHRDRGDGHHHDEHGSPTQGGDQAPAEHRPGGQPDPGHPTPHPEGSGSSVPFGKPVCDQRQRAGHDRGRAHALHRARRDQDRRRRRSRARGAGHREQCRTAQVDPAGTPAVAEAARGEHQRRERHGVGVEHPLHRDHRSAQRPGDVPGGHVDRGGVEEHQEKAQTDPGEGHPCAAPSGPANTLGCRVPAPRVVWAGVTTRAGVGHARAGGCRISHRRYSMLPEVVACECGIPTVGLCPDRRQHVETQRRVCRGLHPSQALVIGMPRVQAIID